jgi:DNA-binding CsgD family transcriptional regulator
MSLYDAGAAACKDDLDLFEAPQYKGSVSREDKERFQIAKAICDSCPIIDNCRADKAVQKSVGFRHGELWNSRDGHRPRLIKLSPIGRTRPTHPPLPVGEKTCPRCETSKPFVEFNVARDRRDGRSTYCKPCYQIISTEHRARVRRNQANFRERNRPNPDRLDLARIDRVIGRTATWGTLSEAEKVEAVALFVGTPKDEVARVLGIGPKTVSKYINRSGQAERWAA